MLGGTKFHIIASGWKPPWRTQLPTYISGYRTPEPAAVREGSVRMGMAKTSPINEFNVAMGVAKTSPINFPSLD